MLPECLHGSPNRMTQSSKSNGTRRERNRRVYDERALVAAGNEDLPANCGKKRTLADSIGLMNRQCRSVKTGKLRELLQS